MEKKEEQEIESALARVLAKRDKEHPRATAAQIEKAVEAGVQKAFENVGIDTSTTEARLHSQADHRFLRKARRLHDALGKYIAFAILAAAGSVLIYFVSMISKD